MADTPQNPQTGPGSSAQFQQGVSREAINNQGDFNNLLRDSANILKKIATTYDNIEARIETLNKSSINIGKINTELLKAKQKEQITSKNIQQLSKQMESASLVRKRQADIYIEQLKKIETLDGIQRDIEQQRLANAFELLDAEQQSYINNVTANKIAKQSVTYAEGKLKAEKEVAKRVGYTGEILNIINKRLKLGGGLYEKMVEEAREGVSTTSNWIKAGAIFVGSVMLINKGFEKVRETVEKLGLSIKGLSEDSGNLVGGLTSGVSSILKSLPVVGGILGGVVDGFSSIADLILGTDNRIVKAGRSLGMTAQQAEVLNNELSKAAYNSGNIFMNSKKLLESQVEISDQLGINNKLSVENLQTNRMLKDFAGLEADTRAEIATSSQITGKSMTQITKSIVGQTAALKQTTGIAFNYQKIIKEAASQGGYLGLQFAKYPEKLAKSLQTVKALGLDLKQLQGMGDSLLDFESSISKEFEAQLITGKQINLQKARELFLNNDLAGAAIEINKQIGSSQEFLKMNRFEAQSISEAFGMSVDQMGDMLKKQELYSKLGVKQGTNAREMLKIATERYNSQEKLNDALTEEGYQSLVNASAQENIAEYIEKIKQSIVDFVQNSKIIDKIKSFVEWMSNPDNVKKTLEYVKNIVAKIADTVGWMISAIAKGLNWLPGDLLSNTQYEQIKSFTGGLGDAIRNFGTTEVKDAVVLPDSGQVIQKDPQDYMIFSKNPQNINNAPQQISQPQLIQVVLQADGEVLSKINLKAQSRGLFYSTDTQTAPYDDQRG